MLEVGDDFYGYKVHKVAEGAGGRSVLFVRGNEGVCITIPYEDYFNMIVSPQERERVEDHLAAALYAAFKDKASGIWSKS